MIGHRHGVKTTLGEYSMKPGSFLQQYNWPSAKKNLKVRLMIQGPSPRPPNEVQGRVPMGAQGSAHSEAHAIYASQGP